VFEDLPVNEEAAETEPAIEAEPVPEDELEVLDGLPVLAESSIERVRRAPLPAPTRQVAAVAATGFVAGAATLAIVHRRKTRLAPRKGLARRKKNGGKVGFGEIVTSNSFLVDVHLLRRD
jgi:hypothetical protein